MKISVALAVYNESKNMHYALDSVIDWVDEIVIVDGGSTDDTVAKALHYGPKVRVISTDNPPMFHINKQKAIAAAQGEWILQLDADEAITPALRAEIATIISADRAAAGYWIPRLNYFLGRFLRKGGVYPDYTLRLYRRGTAHFPCKDVHENVAIVGPTDYLKEPMEHYSDPAWSRYIARWHRYCKAEALRMRDMNERVSTIALLWRPIPTFLQTYFRHLGVLDGWQGFLFHAMSALRWWGICWYRKHE